MKRFVFVVSLLLVFLFCVGFVGTPTLAEAKTVKKTPMDLTDKEWQEIFERTDSFMELPEVMTTVFPDQKKTSTLTDAHTGHVTLEDGTEIIASVLQFDSSITLYDDDLIKIAETYALTLNASFGELVGEELDWSNEESYGPISESYDVFVHFFTVGATEPYKFYLVPQGERGVVDVFELLG